LHKRAMESVGIRPGTLMSRKPSYYNYRGTLHAVLSNPRRPILHAISIRARYFESVHIFRIAIGFILNKTRCGIII
jgi:hypothetical protein